MPDVDTGVEDEVILGLGRPSGMPELRRLVLDRIAGRFDDELEFVPALRCTPPAGTAGMVDNNGFCGKEEGRTVRGADDSGFCSICRSFASKAAILSFVLKPEILSLTKMLCKELTLLVGCEF